MNASPSQEFPKTALESPRYAVGTVLFSRTDKNNLIPSLESFFRNPAANNFVCVSNVHTTVECRRDERLRRIQNGSYLTIADGQPVILYGRMTGTVGIERIMGPDIMAEVFAAETCRQRRHYFLGGTQATLGKLERNLRARYPWIQIAGIHSPPFRKLTKVEEEALAAEIRSTRPDYLWVCFGAPKQEYWMEDNHAHFPGTLLIGIGAGFAYHAGELKRAPIWAQRIACEWIWRLAQDPKRLWKRYLKTNPVFALMMAKVWLRRLASRVAWRFSQSCGQDK